MMEQFLTENTISVRKLVSIRAMSRDVVADAQKSPAISGRVFIISTCGM